MLLEYGNGDFIMGKGKGKGKGKVLIKGKSMGDLWQYSVQKYPANTKDYYFNKSRQYKLIGPETKVCSMGSCFGIEIAKLLKRLKFKYLVTERNALFSANWEKLYNISSIRQVFQYSLSEFNPIVHWWDRNGLMQDPFRRGIEYQPGTETIKFNQHVQASKQALSQADVITITLGMVELWRDKRDGATYWRVPPKQHYNPKIHEFHVQTVDEVLEEMRTIRALAGKTKIIWTVSPVPFMATFRNDTDPITANFYSKACLRSAVEMMVNEDEHSYYFPSYEAIILGHENRYRPDNRHITQVIINQTIQFFKRMYMK